MATIRKSITFTEQQDAWIKQQIEKGDFTNDSEYIRDLVRQDQAKHRQITELETALQEGLDSGISDKSVSDIMQEVEDRMRADGRL
ncbi:type II toxin-antitoxin system ParD family antitoxin [Ulvibacterium marinum]|uniref:Type II toxin-antitoxin system ParD family antitoxin n=1 Tax=Ulvibacterium marinum TaxID=2419782 RepID=A0A3B0C5Z2_9FLAO|nr:type II toxin-antitoxin system ParD family antitoxin [Ulvibacterium marinum]RKN80241.1 type II toxin-antitoxin system ParD family antitoxin [Ulvibacterium marinum]